MENRLFNVFVVSSFFFFLLCALVVEAQNTVVMPHQGVDTLWVTPSGCYTVLDPGGTGKYQNNEDSYLYVISTDNSSMYFQVEYEFGYTNDGKDWLRIYSDTVTWVWSSYFAGAGKSQAGVVSSRALFHFHSNAYNTYDGFTITIQHYNTVYNQNYTTVNDSTIHLTWQDYNNSASEWTVYYTCRDDTLLSATSTSMSVDISSLQPDRYYKYYIVNNSSLCSYPVYNWFAALSDSTLLVMEPQTWQNEILPSNSCYTLVDPEQYSLSMNIPSSSRTYCFNDGHGVYLRGNISILSGSVSIYYNLLHNGGIDGDFYYSNRTNLSHFQWYPNGCVQVTTSGTTAYRFDVLPENDNVVQPHETNVTSSSATITWTDTSNSTSWTFSYSDYEGGWRRLNVSTPSVTLTGLSPHRQYVYTIEGNDTFLPCMVPARHAFITSGSSDTLIMPFRGDTTVVIQPGLCYTIVDAGSNHGYFNADLSRMVIRTSNHKGIRLKGYCNIKSPDLLTICDGERWMTYRSDVYSIEITSIYDSLVVCFQSDAEITRNGFVLQVFQVEDSIYDLHVDNISANSATVKWSDLSAATSWTLHYGLSEDNMLSIAATDTVVNLTGLTPGRQYVYYVTHDTQANCSFSERKGFITLGLPANEVLLPFRSIDTLVLQSGTCYRIWDPGGQQCNYFNNDTSTLVIVSSDGSDFAIVGEWLSNGNEAEYLNNGYDTYDRVWFQTNPNSNYYSNYYDGWYSRHRGANTIRYNSSNGYLRMRFTSNSSFTMPGFCFTIDRAGGEVNTVTLSRVTSSLATVNWVDNSGNMQWNVAYRPYGGNFTTVQTTTRNCTLTGLSPNTFYEVIVYPQGGQQCDYPTTCFTTLSSNDIIMPHNGSDTVYISPGQCYYVYDPGGTGNYLPSDTSYLVIRSTDGQGFYQIGSGNVGNQDYNDYIYIKNIVNGRLWWGWENWVNDGELVLAMRTNEAIQESGFYIKILFPSSSFNPDTINRTDSTVTIVWQDTSAATQWNFSYGTHVDSMSTFTTSVKQFNMTGLKPNRQYFYSIYSTLEDKDCVLENYYGVIIPTDQSVIIDPYLNHYLQNAGRYSLYHNSNIYMSPEQCFHFMDEGGVGNLFRNSDNRFRFYTTNNQALTLRGYYNLGSSSLYISNHQQGAWYYNTGYLNVYSPDGYFNIQQHTGTSTSDYAPGFNFDILFNYRIYNIRSQNVTCTSAQLLWDDSSSATQWTLVYGPTEKMLDTIVVNSKNIILDSLFPDHQYVCYLSSNDSSLDCYMPVKYCFITTCDTTIFVVPYNYDTIRVLDINNCYTIYDAGSDMDYFYNDNHYFTIKSSTGNAIKIRGYVYMGDNDDITIRDGVTGKYLGSWSQADNIEVLVPSGTARFYYRSAGDTVTGAGFKFDVSFQAISNIQISLKTDTTCRLTWSDNTNATSWTCYYGLEKDNMDSIVTTQTMVHLSNLIYGKRYYVFFTNNSVACIDTTWFDFCAGGDKCVDFGDVYSCFATAYYGRFSNPVSYKGMVDYGADDINSRHTLIDDTNATDPRTGYQLRCVPPGYPNSVRLGNWDIGGEAESIEYEYDVDTTKSEILLLRYAAVLENPGHSPSMQPRFRFSIVDENGYDIDADCYSADFISSASLGWNTFQYDTNTILWKDWTAVGVDLAPLDGQKIYVRLTTYDCNEMGHFGYAYFTLECEDKVVMPNECGVVHSNEFSAPEGFRYRWFNIDSSNVTLSTDRTFSSSQNGIYKCRASFLGSTGDNCYFEKTAVVGDIFPFANFSYEIVDTVDCNVVVQFRNLSCVTLDSLHTQPTAMECDDFLWDFGDGSVSYEKHPAHIFPSSEFNVTLTASLAGGSCSDDTTQFILMRSPCISYDSLYPEICDGDTFALRDSVLTTDGLHTIRTEYRPDSIVTTFVFLIVHPTLDTNLFGGICDGRVYDRYGFTDSVAGDYVHAFTSIYGCDSIYRLHLVVSSSYDTVVNRHGCTSSGFAYGDTVFWTSTVYTDSLLSIYSCDSVVTMNITITQSYYNKHFDTICEGDTFYFPDYPYPYTFSTTISFITTTAAGCDSTDVFNLTVNPRYSSFDTAYICLSESYTYRGQPYAPQLIVDSLTSVGRCDSVVHIDVRYYDTTFGVRSFFSLDSLTWMPFDTNYLAGCFPLRVFFVDSANIVSIHRTNVWFFGDDSDSYEDFDTISHIYSDTSLYTVVNILMDDYGCVDSAFATIQVYPLPIPDFEITPDLISTVHPEVILINHSFPDNDSSYYLWYFYQHSGADEDPVDTSFLANPSYTWNDIGEDLTGDHDVMLIAFQHYTTLVGDSLVCSDTLRLPVNIVNIFLQFPTAVTPNGDGVNDKWHIVNIEYGIYPVNRLRIYDRWGRLVFKRDNITTTSDDWDPNDCDCPDGTYFYRFDSLGEPGHIQHNGAIEVIR